jgi:predicted unusual protein kinase regulating ubiquinone biosynthesis (AarF/ABC1/UbiB family)
MVGTLAPPPSALLSSPRALVLATVAADIYTGYATLRDRARRRPDLVAARDWEAQHRRGARRALDTAVSLGGLLIKAGQFASTRADLLPAAYVETLAALQDRVPPHPWPAIEPVLTAELGRPLRDVFDAIDREPVAAASLAQVHRARLHDGRAVAVKVQYPEVAGLVAADLSALTWIVETIARLEPRVRLQPIIDHLRATLPLELDFGREAAMMERLRAALAHRDDVVVPAAVAEYSTERLLVMTYVDGVKVTDRAALVDAGIDPVAVARILNDVYAEQMLRHGLLHADPHPGNLLVQPGPRVVLLDHGLTVELPPGLVRALRRMVRALRAFDFDELAAALGDAGVPVDAELDLGSLLQVAGVLFGETEPGAAFDAARRLPVDVGALPEEMVLVGRALGALGGITQTLAPDLDVLEIVAHHA